MILNKKVITADLTPYTWIDVNGENKQVMKVNDKTIVIKDSDGEKRISKSDISDKIIKFTVTDRINKKVYEVLYSDYGLITSLNSGDFVNGSITTIKTKAKAGMSAKIDDLKTCEKMNVYGVDRYGIIVGREGSKYDILLNTGTIVRLHRTKFSLDNEKDVKIFFRPNNN